MTKLHALLAALTLTLGALLVPAAPASALTRQACNYDNITFNACITMETKPYFWHDVVGGLDVYMPTVNAQWNVTCGTWYRAKLMGEDGSTDQFIRNLVIRPGWPQAGPGQLSVEFYTLNVSGDQLDEDSDGADEIFVRLEFYDCALDKIRTFDTGQIVARFSS